jgi:hypothetical protein
MLESSARKLLILLEANGDGQLDQLAPETGFV